MENFNELALNPLILRAITDMGYEKPSPIQAQTLPLLLGKQTDFLGLAATGTGKTAAFAIPLLERIDPKRREVQGLILCPTRELAQQVAGQINLLGQYLKISALPIYGGAPYGDQIRGLRSGATIVVGTPGRVIDHIERGTLRIEGVQTMILDEADEMISMGFKDDLETILGGLAEGICNTWLFSATMGSDVRRVADKYLNDPKQVQVNKKEMLSGTVEQFYYLTSESNKPEVLCKLMDAAPEFYGLIFCQMKTLVADLTQYLKGRNYQVDCLHGDMDQNARERTMKAFRERKTRILVCTDVACRGLDVKDITHVVNYSLPRELENYVHRIGRTARSGKSGIAMSLVSPAHRMLVGRIERLTKTRIREGQIPTRKDIAMKKIAQALPQFQEQVTAFTLAQDLLDPTWKAALATMKREEIAGRFLALMYPEIFVEKSKEVEAPKAISTHKIITTPKTFGGPKSFNGPRFFNGPKPSGAHKIKLRSNPQHTAESRRFS
ncbi:DEAD/DEAH box helicase [Bdellovibrionota bacterium FG-2]